VPFDVNVRTFLSFPLISCTLANALALEDTAEELLLDGSAADDETVVPPIVNVLAVAAAAVLVPIFVTAIEPPVILTDPGRCNANVSVIFTVVLADVPSKIRWLAMLIAISPSTNEPLDGVTPPLVVFLNL